MAKTYFKICYPLQVRGTLSKNGRSSLIYAHLISCNKKGDVKMKSTGSCSTTIVLKEQMYSFEPDNLISLLGSILSKVHILECCEQPFINRKYLHWATANTHYSNMDSESNL